MILTLVLGKITERNLFLAQQIHGWAWVGRPLVVALAVGIIVGALVFRRREPRRLIKDPPFSDHTEAQPVGMRPADVIFSLGLAGAFFWGIVEAWQWPLQTRLFPMVFSIPMLALAIYHAAKCIRVDSFRGVPMASDELSTLAEGNDPPPVLEASALINARSRDILTPALQCLTFYLSVALFGLLATVALFSLLYLRLVSRQAWWRSLEITALASLITWGGFQTLLHMRIPSGILWRILT
jgi:hypothetical protein